MKDGQQAGTTTTTVYVEYIDGVYYMFNLRHPGFRISLNMFGDGNYGNHYGRIANVSYRAHFGHDHWFHMGRPEMIGGYNRFHYGGYWFGFNEEWPVGWDYNDDCYVEYIDGGYYMYNLRHPGFHLTLRLFSRFIQRAFGGAQSARAGRVAPRVV